MCDAREDICEIRVQSSDSSRPFAKAQVCTWVQSPSVFSSNKFCGFSDKTIGKFYHFFLFSIRLTFPFFLGKLQKIYVTKKPKKKKKKKT
jgi:hypothetical protein